VTRPDASVSHTVAAELYDEFLASGTPGEAGRPVEFIIRWKIGTTLVVRVPVLRLISVQYLICVCILDHGRLAGDPYFFISVLYFFSF